MSRCLSICMLLLVVFSCKKKVEETPVLDSNTNETSYASFGNMIIADDAIKASSMANHYKTMRVGDTINSKMLAKVNEVCQAKGCWMTLNLDDADQAMVKFKDYSFFMPKDISGHDVIVNGKAYVTEVSVEEQRHYAEDAGKSKEEIENITEPKRTYAFLADGVLLIQ